MSLLGCWPHSRRCAASAHRITLVAIGLLLLLSHCSLVLSDATSIAFLNNQAYSYLTVPAGSTSVSITVLYPYLNTTLLAHSNATASTASLPNGFGGTISQLPANESQSFLPDATTSILVLPVTLDPSSDYYTFYSECRMGPTQQPPVPVGLCNITLTFNAPAHSTVAYSLYHMPQIGFNTLYTSQLAADTWQYYALWITYDELDVVFTLTPFAVSGGTNNPDADLWLAAVSNFTSPLVPVFPTNEDGSYAYVHTSGPEGVELTDGDGVWQDGLYIVGVHAPSFTNGVSGYTLLLQSGLSDYTSGSSVEVSMFAIVGALVVLVLCLFSAAALIARRRRSYIRDLHLFDSPSRRWS